MILFLLVAYLLVCVFAYDIKFRKSRLFNVAKRYPTCFTELPVVGSLYRLIGNSEELMSTLIKIANATVKLGGISRLCGLSNCFLVITDRADAAEVFKYYLNKDNTYKFLQTISGNGSVFNTDHTQSRVRRQIFLPSLSSRRLSTYTDSIIRESKRLVETLALYVDKGPFSITWALGGFCFDNVIGAADVEEIKEEFNSEKTSWDYLQCFNLIVERYTSLWMHSHFLHRLTSNYRKTEEIVSTLYKYSDKIQEMRRNKLERFHSERKSEVGDSKGDSMKPGLFDSLINSKLSRREINEEILVLFIASDEAAILMSFTLKLLSLYPAAQEKVYKELMNTFGKSGRPLVKDDIMKMSYLDMVIKETMRLYPPVPIILRTSEIETKLSSGNVIPAGASLAISIYSLHRQPSYWGPDADHFDPERFLPERLTTVPDNAYVPFSYGPRGCPGYKFALSIAKIGLCSILQKYKVVGTPAAGPVPDIPIRFEVTMRPVDDSIELVHR